MKLALGPVQSNAKGGRYVSLTDSEEIFYRRNCAVEIRWEPGNFQDDGAKRLGICFTADPDLRNWALSVEDTVVDNMIVQQSPFPGASRTERAVKVSPKGQHVKAKIPGRCWRKAASAGGLRAAAQPRTRDRRGDRREEVPLALQRQGLRPRRSQLAH